MDITMAKLPTQRLARNDAQRKFDGEGMRVAA